jgi:4-diphosphocytidyl-2-C-methyl-D-erythritol kinase
LSADLDAWSRRTRAPAKLNLGLRIRGRRADGYHLLDSVFVPLALADEIEIAGAPGTGIHLRLEGAARGVPAGDDNLVYRAAASFLESRGEALRLEIALRKRIPAAAGLGGGSSDAGAVLRTLDAEVGGVPPEALAEVALRLGADVPFFLDPRPARVRGIGERIDPLPDLPDLAVLLVHPGTELATAAVFGAYAAGDRGAGRPEPRSPVRELRRFAQTGRHTPELEGALQNDLEAAARRLCPALDPLRDRLREAGAETMAMSGSGPTLYALFPAFEEAREVHDRLGPLLEAHQQRWLTKTVRRPAECVT